MAIDDWLTTPETPDTWEVLEGAGSPGGVMRGRYVTHDHDVGFLKPGPEHMYEAEQTPSYCPALERIAARLAHELEAQNISVLPVQLYRADAYEEGVQYPACISFTDPGNPVVPTMEAVYSVYGPGIVERVESAFAEFVNITVFDCWLAADDRNDENVLVTGLDFLHVKPRIISIDYSKSMIFHEWWRSGDFDNPGDGYVPQLRTWLGTNDLSALSGTVFAIQGIPDETVKRIVEEVPEWFLSEQSRGIVLEGLLRRKSRLDRIWDSWRHLNDLG